MAKSASKKRKLNGEPKTEDSQSATAGSPAHSKGRNWTVTVAIPSNMIDMNDSLESRSLLALQLARALSTSSIDHVILLPSPSPSQSTTDATSFLNLALSYLETPPYMRQRLFSPGTTPLPPYLTHLFSLPALSTSLPHHLTTFPSSLYRDGVTLKAQDQTTYHRLVNAGLPSSVLASIPDAIPKSTRVTLKFAADAVSAAALAEAAETKRAVPAEVVDPAAVREEVGWYGGYAVSTCAGLAAVFQECPYEEGYDVSMLVFDGEGEDVAAVAVDEEARGFKHLLLAFGREEDFEAIAEKDAQLASLGVASFADVFDRRVDLTRGFRTVGRGVMRSEEMVWMGLAGLRPLLGGRD